MSGLVFIEPLTADHGGVVAAVAKLREIELVSGFGAGGQEVSADAAVGGHTAGHGQLTVALGTQSGHGSGNQAVAHRPAKAGGKGGQVQFLTLLLGVVDQVKAGGL